MAKKLEEKTLACRECNGFTNHKYLGDYGTPWKHIYVYQCRDCKTQKQYKYNKPGEPIE